ncbi:MAG: hypothetical protein ACYC2H_00160 [Thermoplasmatota archaeon]
MTPTATPLLAGRKKSDNAQSRYPCVQGRHAFAWCALLILLPVAGLASSGADGLSATSATLTGDASAQADLAGLAIEGPACTKALSLSLTATQGTLEVDHETTSVWIPPSVGTPANNTRETTPLSKASISGFDVREGCRILGLAAPGSALRATATLGATQFQPPAANGLTFEPRASFDRDRMEIPAATLPVEPTQPSTLTIQGPFLLVVWESSFLIHDANGTRTVQTGAESQPLAGPTPAQRQIQREAYLHVEQGALHVSIEPGVRLYANSLDLDVRTGRLQLHEPEGTLPLGNSPIPAGSKLLELESPTTANLVPRGSRLGTNIQDKPPRVILDGVAVMTEPTPDMRQAWLLGTIGVAVVAGAVVILARVRARRRMTQLEKLLAEQRYVEALALARKTQSGLSREQARLTEATCLIRLSRFGEAHEALAGDRWSPTSSPLRDYLLANVEAGRGHPALAVRHLTACLLKAPAFAGEALANPLLAPVVRQVIQANQPPFSGESYA